MNNLSRLLTFVIFSHAVFANTTHAQDLIFYDGFEGCTPGGTVDWDGGGDGTSWFDELNWKGDTLPADGDEVSIRHGETRTVVYNSGSNSLRITCLDSNKSLNVTGGILEIDGRGSIGLNSSVTNGTLTTTGDLAISGTLEQSGGVMNGLGTVTVGDVFTWSGGNQSEAGETIANGGVVLSGASGRDQNSRTLTMNGASTWSAGRTRLWHGATINNNAAFDIQTDEDMLFHLGDVSTFNNNGSGSITKSTGSAVTQFDMIFNNSGAVAVTSGELWVGQSNVAGTSSGSFDTAVGGVLGVTGSHTMSGSSSFTGTGTFVNLNGGTTVISGSYTMSGPLLVKAGTLRFDIPVAIGDDVTVTGGALVYTQATSVNGNVALSAGTLTATGSLTISGTLAQSSGTMNGLGTVTAGDVFTWSGGNQSEAGETIANGGVVLSGASGRHQNSRTLTMNGASTWSAGRTSLWHGATINNNAAFDIQTDEDMLFHTGDVSTFNNNGSGSITKSTGSAVTQFDMIFNNSGAVAVTSGELWVGRSNVAGTSSGSFDTAVGGVLGVTGSHTMSGSSSFTGTGTFVNLNGGTTVISGSYTMSGPLLVKAGTLRFDIPVAIGDDVTVTGGALVYTQATSVNGNVALSAGTLTATGSLTISGTLAQSSGTMNGLGTVTAGDVFTWSGGNQSEAGETIANGGVVLSGASGRHQNSRTLTMNGASTWSAGRTSLWHGATINNNAAFDIQTDEDMLFHTGDVSTFNNNGSGSITKSTGSAVTQFDMIFNNSGAVAVTSGELWVGRSNVAGTSSGSFDTAVGGVLGVTGSHTMSGSSSFTGTGTFVNLNGGTTVISGSYTMSGPLLVKAGTLRFDIPVAIGDDVTVTGGALVYTQATSVNGNVALSAGTLTATGSLTISGTLAQSSGTMNGLGTVTAGDVFTWSGGNQSEAGETIANGGVVLSGASGRHQNSRTLTMNGASTWSAGRTSLWHGATINNNAAFDIQTDEDMLFHTGDVSTFNNNGSGSITKSTGSAVTQFDLTFNNAGTVTVNTGVVTFSRQFTQLSTGTLDVHILGASDFDVFAVTQSATLDGTVNIIRDGYTPAGGTAFDIMTCNTCSGSFATVNGNGVTFTQNVTANKVTLTAN